MAQSTLEKVVVRMNLNNGTDPQTGEVHTVAVSLGSINPATYDADKALAITKKVKNCLTKSLYSVSEVKTSTISEE